MLNQIEQKSQNKSKIKKKTSIIPANCANYSRLLSLDSKYTSHILILLPPL